MTNKRILNLPEQKKIATAIRSLEYTVSDGIELAKTIYTTAFSVTFAMSGTTAEALDKVFGGKSEAAEKSIFSAEAPSEVSISISEIVVSGLCGDGTIGDGVICADGLIAGDLIFAQADENEASGAKVYIFDGERIAELTKPYLTYIGVGELLDKLEKCARYALLRPSYALTLEPSEEKTEELDEGQTAVVETAKSYLLRGYRVQYDDTTLCDSSYRWQIGVRAPEDYTSEYWGYSNCAAFAIDVHRYSWGYETEDFSTRHMSNSTKNKIYRYEPTGNETDEEKKAVKDKLLSLLRPADIINVRYARGSSGHAMLYVGNGNIIHSAGRNYNYSEDYPCETYEPTVRIMKPSELFDENNRRYVFSKLASIEILRPLNEWNGILPENTANRIKNLRGVVAEKLCSKKRFNTVSQGEEIEFYFSIFNSNDKAVTLEVSDIVPRYTEYISGAEEMQGDKLFWTVTVPPKKTARVGYTVRVLADAMAGERIYGEDGTVGGVIHRCPAIYIKKTLTSDEQINLSRVAKALCGKGEGEIACVNEIYRRALGYDEVIAARSIDEITEGLFSVTEKGNYSLNRESVYGKMLAPDCYAGRKIELTSFHDDRVARFIRPEYLIPGDVIVFVRSGSQRLYIRTNDDIIDVGTGESVGDLQTFTASLLATKLYMAVLRPSTVQ